MLRKRGWGSLLSWLSFVYLTMSGGRLRVMSFLLMLGPGPTDITFLVSDQGPPESEISLKNSMVCIVILMLCSSCSLT